MASTQQQQEDTSSLPSHVQPQGFAATILGVTALLSILCLLAVSLRLWVRIRDRCFYNEDGFMIAGLIVLLMQYGVTCWGTTVGIGSSDPSVLMNPKLMIGVLKVEYYLNITYVLAMGLIKTSVCGTLIRINKGASRFAISWALWTIMLVIVVSTAGGLITYLVRCTSTTGCEDSTRTMSILNWVGVSFYMACDLGLAIIPIFILKDLHMKRSVKVSTACILGLGGLACLAAILRIPSQLGVFTSSGATAMYTMGNFLIWSELELGLGVICGCAPAIRKLLKGLLKDPPRSSAAPMVKPYPYQSPPGVGGRGPAPPPKDGASYHNRQPYLQQIAGGGSPGMAPRHYPSSEKMHALSPQQTPQSISHPTKTFQTMTTSTTVSNRSLHVDEHSGNGSTRGLIEYDAQPVDVEAVGLWGPRV